MPNTEPSSNNSTAAASPHPAMSPVLYTWHTLVLVHSRSFVANSASRFIYVSPCPVLVMPCIRKAPTKEPSHTQIIYQ